MARHGHRPTVTRRGWAVVVGISLAATAILATAVAEVATRSSAPTANPSPMPAPSDSPLPSPSPSESAEPRDPVRLAAGCADEPADDVLVEGVAGNRVAAAVWHCADRAFVVAGDDPARVAVAAAWAAGTGAVLLLDDDAGALLDDLGADDVMAVGDAVVRGAARRIEAGSPTGLALSAIDELGGDGLVVAHAWDPASLAVASAIASRSGEAVLPVPIPAPAEVVRALQQARHLRLVGRSGTAVSDVEALVEALAAPEATVDRLVSTTHADLVRGITAFDRATPVGVAASPRWPWIVARPSGDVPIDAVHLAVVGAAAASAGADVLPTDTTDLRSPGPVGLPPRDIDGDAERIAAALVEDQPPSGDPASGQPDADERPHDRRRAVVSVPAGVPVVDADDVSWQLDVLAAGLQVPGGGQVLFPHRRFVALYGHARHGSLGVFGEQPPQEAVTRALAVAEGYDADGIPTVPAFDLITTLASASATPDGDYSAPMPLEEVRAIHEVARANGVYLVLDLQPGRTDFLTQAKMYEELLREPDVGLALDPEWRLKPNQVHLRQIGSVDAAEVNQVVDWLAGIVREEALPQKLLMVHQFRFSMITNRETIRTPAELAVMIHMDGQGGLASKYDSYDALIDPGQPWWPGWKNFYDEDHPMATSEQVLALEPTPWFVSFQ